MDPNAAGFVQIMRGRAVDPDAMRVTSTEMEKELSEARPDIMGGIVGFHGDREFIQAIYFTSTRSRARGRDGHAGRRRCRGVGQAMIEGH